jgi:hypothetical protein
MKLFSNLKNQATSFLDQYKQQNPATYAAAEQAIGAILIADGLIGIDNPFGNNKRPGIFGAVLIVILGTIFLFVPTYIGNFAGTKSMIATTTATVTAVNNNTDTCSLTASYIVNGQTYTKPGSDSSSSDCALTVGQSITINYNPETPGAWSHNVKSLEAFLKIFFFAGVIMIISGLVTFIIRLVSIIFGWKLLRNGRKLASTLPEDTDFQSLINEIKQSFTKVVFGGGPIPNLGSDTQIIESHALNTNQEQSQISQPANPINNQPSEQTPQPNVDVPTPKNEDINQT